MRRALLTLLLALAGCAGPQLDQSEEMRALRDDPAPCGCAAPEGSCNMPCSTCCTPQPCKPQEPLPTAACCE